MITTSMALSTDLSPKQLVEIGYDLQKQLRAKDAVAKKEKAVLEQKIELLEIQLREGKEREDNMRKMYETMIGALKPSASETTKMAKELELINELHQKELAEAKQRQLEITSSLERQINDLRLCMAQQDHDLRNAQRRQEDIEREYKAKLLESENRQKELEAKIGELESTRKKQKEIAALDAEVKLANANAAVEKAKTEHAQELERVKQQYEQTLKEIKYIYEREKLINEGKLEKANNEIKELTAQKETCSTNRNLQEIQEAYLEEIRELNEQLELFKKVAHEELEGYKKQRDELANKVETLEQQIAKKPVSKMDQSGEEDMSEENYNLRQQIDNLKTYIAKLESNVLANHHEKVPSITSKPSKCNLPSIF